MFESADDEKVNEAVYKLIFHISEKLLAPTISDMRGSTVHLPSQFLHLQNHCDLCILSFLR